MPNLPNFRRQAMGDVVPAMLEPGEFVINRNAVNTLGVDNLEILNESGGAHSAIDELIASATVASTLQNAKPPHFQEGGEVPSSWGQRFVERFPSRHEDPERAVGQERGLSNVIDALSMLVPGIDPAALISGSREISKLIPPKVADTDLDYGSLLVSSLLGPFGGRAIKHWKKQPNKGKQQGGQVRGYQQGGKIENGKKPKKTLDQLLLELQLMETHGSDKDKIPKGSPLEPVFSAMGKYPHHPKYLIDGEWVSGNPDMDDSTMMNAPMRMMFYTPDKGWVGMETILGYDEYQSYKNIDKQSLKKEIGFKSPKSGNNYQEGGQVYQGPPYEPSEADFGRQVNPFTGEEMNIAEDKKRMALQMLKSLGVGKGQRIDSDARDSLMGMSDDTRIIPPLPPDEYVMRQENGEMYMSKQQVPKLSPAYMASFGMETPLSKRQRSLLQRRAINPESMSPQLRGLLGKVLLQRLENEPE